MDRKTKLILSIYTVFCTIILIYCFIQLDISIIPHLIYWIFLASVCESLPVYLSKNRAVSVNFAILLACQLSHGTYLTTIVAALCNIFVVIKESDESYKHVLNTPFYKTMMNITNFTISIFLAGSLYDWVNQYYLIRENVVLFILNIILFVSIVFLINSITIVLFSIPKGTPFFKTWIKGTFWAYPNFLAIAPIGFFVYLFYQMKYGYIYILLILGPLLLARYSFKLYLDSQDQYFKTIKTLSAAIEAKDKYTVGHSRRVECYAELVAKKMNFSSDKIQQIKIAALLHDIGKIGIDDSILSKPGKLTEEEWWEIKQHPQIGVRILKDVPFSETTKEAILHHHERYDGSGYPDGLKGDEVSIAAYILGAVDAYDAMTSDRPYRKGLSKETAIENLKNGKGKQFHPQVVDVFISILDDIDNIDECNDAQTEVTYAIN